MQHMTKTSGLSTRAQQTQLKAIMKPTASIPVPCVSSHKNEVNCRLLKCGPASQLAEMPEQKREENGER